MIVYYLNLFKRYFVFVMYISIRNRIEMNMWNSSSYVYLVGLSQVKYKYKYNQFVYYFISIRLPIKNEEEKKEFDVICYSYVPRISYSYR